MIPNDSESNVCISSQSFAGQEKQDRNGIKTEAWVERYVFSEMF